MQTYSQGYNDIVFKVEFQIGSSQCNQHYEVTIM